MFDGLEFQPTARPELQYNPTSMESIKTSMIKTFIPAQIDEILPQGLLDNDELVIQLIILALLQINIFYNFFHSNIIVLTALDAVPFHELYRSG